ncbi:MAG: glutathione S-transferase N-terminal domain-containing protein [Kofleriaceae bacterium]|jgi:glutathione S-transferase|nr:glutathione S-transferase N-terminal domain-containing protein [Kofleriaceae bacterium]MBP9170385.1 glutathione S-transferase N-terminal domain-containing protein [Kofleriaceae bacterium]MBP9860053.1 glutathione S-transferase N-terminal domain-containing protein [Kofleriaceae bacterium]
MKLYYSPGTCALAVHICLREAGAEFTLERVKRDKSLVSGGSYLAIQPLGYVPALSLADGTLLTEVTAILGWLADAYPDAHLAPTAGTLARAQFASTLGFIATEVHARFSPLFGGFAEDVKASFRERLNGRIAHLAPRLAHGHVFGDHFTAADAYLFTVLSWARLVAVELPPEATAYLDQLRTRPTIIAAMTAEGLIKPAA